MPKPLRPARRAAAAKRRASPKTKPLKSDPGAAFCRAVDTALKNGTPENLSDAELRRVLTAVVKAYAAKAEDSGREVAPFVAGAVTATEAVVAACAMIRAVDLNLFDVAMWFRRPVASEQ